jgi:hypothetical protein
MVKSRLTPDYIERVMSLNANQALRGITRGKQIDKTFENGVCEVGLKSGN